MYKQIYALLWGCAWMNALGWILLKAGFTDENTASKSPCKVFASEMMALLVITGLMKVCTQLTESGIMLEKERLLNREGGSSYVGNFRTRR